ncbi:MAG: hypothetical protein ABI895_32185 [Deltaproteobacteria bacterium]
MTIKRRLQLLPEVLPKPQVASGPSSVRSRALARLSVLAALSAAQASCGGDAAYGVVDPLARPGGEGGSRNDLPPTLGGSGGGGGAGAYGVVDPLPPPASCFSGTVLAASASYVGGAAATDAGAANGAASGDAGIEDGGRPRAPENEGGANPITRTSEVQVDLDTAPQVNLGPALPLTPGIQLVQQTSSSGHTTLLFSIPEATEAEVVLPALCGGQQVNLRMQLLLYESGISVSVSTF